MKIAGKLTIKDWNDLVGSIEKSEANIIYDSDEKWSLAFNFFEERIRTRYLNPIKAILEMDDNLGEGFAVVNLQCSLIEMIESFINGWVYIHKPRGWYRNNKKSEVINNACIFKSFFSNRFIKNLKIDGGDFYDSVRCGLLHETQTKNNWKIKLDTEKTGLSYEEKDDEKFIYRENFQRDLETVINNYKAAITKKENLNGDKIENFNGIEINELRKNFISKFNHICKESTEK